MPDDIIKQERALQAARDLHEEKLRGLQIALDEHAAAVRTKADLDDVIKLKKAEFESKKEFIQASKDEQVAILALLRAKLDLSATTAADRVLIEADIARYKNLIKESTRMQKALSEESARWKELADARQSAQKAGEALAEGIFGLDNKILKLGETLKKATEGDGGLKDFAKGFKKALKPAKLMGAGLLKLSEAATFFLMASVKLALAQEETIAKFKAATGAGNEFNAAMTGMQREMAFSGVTVEEAGESFTALYSTMSAFTEESGTVQKEIGGTVALLAQFGVAAETSAKNLDFATRAMGMTGMEAEGLLRDLKSTADALQVPPAKIAESFAAAAPILARHGKDMMKVFDGLAAHAKATGLEVSQLLNVVGKFDTFEGAATSVGRLNAIMGGPYLNSIDMLNATEEERIDILKRSIDMSGMQFDQMGRFEKMAMADALGMSVEEASRIFGASTIEMEKQALAQEKLADQAAKVQSIMQQLKAAFSALLIDMRPWIDEVLMPMIDGWREAAKGGDTFGKKLDEIRQKILMWSGVLGTILLVAGVAAMFFPATIMMGLPMIMAGASMLGVSIAGATAAGAARKQSVKRRVEETAAPLGRNVRRAASGGVVGPSSALTMVGEGGPELVEMPTGSRVTSAPATKELTDSLQRLTNKIDRLGSGSGREQPVVIKIGEREFGSIVLNSLDRNRNALLTSS